MWNKATNARVRLAATIPLALACVACAPKPVLTLPPADLAVCADEPLAPDLPGREQQAQRDSLTLAYILALRSAWGDCRAKVDGLRAWRESAE
jgi:hypothetical protein